MGQRNGKRSRSATRGSGEKEPSPAEVAEAIAPFLDFLRGGNEAFERSQRERERAATRTRSRGEATDKKEAPRDRGPVS